MSGMAVSTAPPELSLLTLILPDTHSQCDHDNVSYICWILYLHYPKWK